MYCHTVWYGSFFVAPTRQSEAGMHESVLAGCKNTEHEVRSVRVKLLLLVDLMCNTHYN